MESFTAIELIIPWIKTSYRILYEIYFVYVCLKTCRWKRLGNIRILVVRIYYIDINIFIDISTGFLKFTLIYSIDTFTFTIYILLMNIRWETDVVNFIIMSLKRLRIVKTFNINRTEQIKFASAQSIRCSTKRWISSEKGNKIFGLFDSLYKIY